MRTLIFLRHAKSSWALPGIDDFDRPLNDRGNETAPQMAHWLLDQGVKPDVIVCSPALRTRETLAHIEPVIGEQATTVMEPTLYLASSKTLIDVAGELDDQFETAILLAHNPGLHDAALRVLNATSRRASGEMQAHFPTCACAIISLPIDSWQNIRSEIGDLRAYMFPKGLTSV